MAKNRKRKKNSNKAIQNFSENSFLKNQLRKLPIDTCYILPKWQEIGQTAIVIMRKHVNGNYSAAVYNIDLLCKGITDTFFLINRPKHEIEEEVLSEEDEICLYSLAHNIIWGAVEYAEDLGLKPHKDFIKTRYFLEQDTEDIEFIDIEFGRANRPVVIIDNKNKNYSVINTLDKTIGSDNYDIINIDEEFNLPDDLPLKYDELGFLSHEEMMDELYERNLQEEIEEYFEVFSEIFEKNKNIDIKNIPANYTEITVVRIIETLYFITKTSNIEIEPDWQSLFAQLFFNFIPESPFDIPDEKITYEPIDLGYNKTDTEERNHTKLVNKLNSGRRNLNRQIKKQIRLYPDNPVFKGLLYKCLFEKDKISEIKKTIVADYEKHADYLFLKLYYGELLLKENQYEKIYEIFENKTKLDELYPERNKFHITEYVGFCYFFIKFNIAIEQPETAIQYYNSLTKYYVEGNEKIMAFISQLILEVKSQFLATVNLKSN